MLDALSVSHWVDEAGLGEAAIVVRELDALPDGDPPRAVDLNPWGTFAAASTIKVPIVAALVADWEAGVRSPADCVAIDPADMTPTDGGSPFEPGYAASLEELGRLALVRSDNVATNTLIQLLGRDRITERCRTWGLRETAVRRKLSGSEPLIADPGATGRNRFPAADAAELYARIAFGVHWQTTWLLDTLFAQEWNDKLSRGLRAGDRFAHKTGDTSEASHDGGILVTPERGRIVVVVHTALPSSAENDARFGTFMRELRAALD